VSAAPTENLEDGLRPLLEDPAGAAILCDIDGTLAPIVERAEEAQLREGVSQLLGRLARRYGVVACVSGRAAAEARRLVGVGSIGYVGSHGAELLEPGAKSAELLDAYVGWEERVREFADERAQRGERRQLRIRTEDKGPITAFHWRGAPDEDAAESWLAGVADEACADGLEIHWGRKVLEIRPPVPVDKGQAVKAMIERHEVRSALYGGDDVTDLDAFDALDALISAGELDCAVRVGVSSDEGPAAIVERADIVVDGVRGFTGVLELLAG
jgi:trehalose 6-phosphate phosphatase